MDFVTEYLPLLLPLVVLQVVLMIIALLDLVRRENTRGPKWLWAIVIVLGELVGPVIYLLIGRKE